MSAVDQINRYVQIVCKRLEEGKVLSFLGAGANLCERPEEAQWQASGHLPSGTELAAHLAESYAFPESEPLDLMRVSQWVEIAAGDAALFDELHAVFAGTYQPNKLHRLLAEIPGMLREKGKPQPGQLLITTNYDDALERAFVTAGEEIDVVYYAATRQQAGRFVHVRPDGKRVAVPKNYRGFDLGQRTVLLKIHGAVDREEESGDSYVITEDHYIDYVARTNVYNLIPAALMAKMSTSHFIFLGYGMRDWNLRVILHHIWSQQARRFASWAIQNSPNPIDEKFWERHGVEIIDLPLESWVEGIRGRLR
jgi:SIR2-like domain